MFETGKPFALLEKDGVVSAYEGTLYECRALKDIESLAREQDQEVIFVLPYCAIRERGFETKEETPVLVLSVDKSAPVNPNDLPDQAIALSKSVTPDIDDQAYAGIISEFQREAIEKGLCSQATISRIFGGQIEAFSIEKALSLYKTLLGQPGHYMTILFYTGVNFLIAGTPERHLQITEKDVLMNPIAGTFRKDDAVPMEEFLQDPKEINELFQVLDEEMKMVCVTCPDGGKIKGPYLREVGSVIHTEYLLKGVRHGKAIDALRQTLHAPTVVGSPMESAAREIARFEKGERRYYGGEIGIYKPDTDTLDSAILIRGAEIEQDGSFKIRAGGGIVRDSIPENEARESYAKASGLIKVLTGEVQNTAFLDQEKHEKYTPLLTKRNVQLSSFWQENQDALPKSKFKDMRVTIINNEDDFAYMLAHMVRALGVQSLEIIDSFDFDAEKDQSDLILIGPGPGDPTDMSHPRMKMLQNIISVLKEGQKRILGICLGHQALAVYHGLEVQRQTRSTQGMPAEVHVKGKKRILAFYNSFSPVYTKDVDGLDFDKDSQNRIIAMRGKNIAGYQFHPESVMSVDGKEVLEEALNHLF